MAFAHDTAKKAVEDTPPAVVPPPSALPDPQLGPRSGGGPTPEEFDRIISEEYARVSAERKQRGEQVLFHGDEITLDIATLDADNASYFVTALNKGDLKLTEDQAKRLRARRNAAKKEEKGTGGGVVAPADPLGFLGAAPGVQKSQFPPFPSEHATALAVGHAFHKHIAEVRGDILARDPHSALDQLALLNHLTLLTTQATHHKQLSKGREAWWHQPTGTIVIHDPKTFDHGTIFKPNQGKAYYDHQT